VLCEIARSASVLCKHRPACQPSGQLNNVGHEGFEVVTTQLVGRSEQTEPSERRNVKARFLQEHTELGIDFLCEPLATATRLPPTARRASTIALLIVVAGRFVTL
jgi:hypothetical protein